MAVRFLSDEWIALVQERLNGSEAFRDAAACSTRAVARRYTCVTAARYSADSRTHRIESGVGRSVGVACRAAAAEGATTGADFGEQATTERRNAPTTILRMLDSTGCTRQP